MVYSIPNPAREGVIDLFWLTASLYGSIELIRYWYKFIRYWYKFIGVKYKAFSNTSLNWLGMKEYLVVYMKLESNFL